MNAATDRLIHAFKWSMGAEVFAKALQPISFIVLARLLTPEDFGVMAAAMMVIGFSQIIWDAGMGKALIQRQSDIRVAANAAFWVNLGLGALVALTLYLLADRIAELIFHDARVEGVLQVMILHVLLEALASVHVALLQKDMQFHRLFWARFAAIGLPWLAAIPLAWYGMGYWALVVGTLVGQLLKVIILWRISSWRPGFDLRRSVSGEMAVFGAWVGLSGLLGWFYIWADSLIVGMFLGSHELGLYRTGSQLVSMAYAVMFGPLLAVLYSHFSQMNGDRERLGRALAKVVKVLTVVALPLGFLAFALQEPVESALFGPKWEGVGLIIGVMALTHGISWVVGANGEVYRAMGKPAYETVVMAFALVVYVAVYLATVNLGLEVFVWSRLALAVGAVFLHFYVAHRLLGLRVRPLLLHMGFTTLVASMFLILGPYSMWIFESPWLQLLAGGIGGLLVVGSLVLLFENRGVVRDIRHLLGRNIS